MYFLGIVFLSASFFLSYFLSGMIDEASFLGGYELFFLSFFVLFIVYYFLVDRVRFFRGFRGVDFFFFFS